jgi:hypothetical protein
VATKKIDIFGLGLEALSKNITAQRRINCYYSVRPDNENNPIIIVQTPGLTLLHQLPNGPVRGMTQNGFYAFVVAGYSLFLIQYTGYTFLGNFGTTSNPYTDVGMQCNLTELVMVDGTNTWTFPISNLAALINKPGQILTGLAPMIQIVNAL